MYVRMYVCTYIRKYTQHTHTQVPGHHMHAVCLYIRTDSTIPHARTYTRTYIHTPIPLGIKAADTLCSDQFRTDTASTLLSPHMDRPTPNTAPQALKRPPILTNCPMPKTNCPTDTLGTTSRLGGYQGLRSNILIQMMLKCVLWMYVHTYTYHH